MEDVAREMFSEFLSDFHRQHPETAGLTPIETMVVRGLPSGRIVEVAEAVAADQVIVGSRGRTGLPHVLLGSVAHRVVQIARPPVTVVKAPRELAE
jgi:nucleotide-binding universal stress UspA family protein